MAPVDLSDAFFESLMQGLDENAFQNDLHSSSPVKPTPTVRRLISPRTTRAKTSTPIKVPPSPLRSVVKIERAPKPEPFWDAASPVASGSGSTYRQDSPTQREMEPDIKPDLLKADEDVKPDIRRILPPKKLAHKNNNNTRVAGNVTKFTTGDEKKPIQHVRIAIGKENVIPTPQVKLDSKGKGKQIVPKVEEAEVDFDALLDDMDWSEDFVLSQPDVKPIQSKTLSQSKAYLRCTVQSITVATDTRRPEKTIFVAVEDIEGVKAVLLRDEWFDTAVEVGYIVNVIGPFDRSKTPALIIDRQSNLLILHPDILVSSTKVADSSQCARKALLQEIIRTTGGTTPSLAYGNMLHELMQTSLTEGKSDEEWRKETINMILEREVQTLWTMKDMTIEKAREELLERSKELGAFNQTFVGAKPGPSSYLMDSRTKESDRPRLAITKTLQVEEDIWSPKYGLKGKVDISISGCVTEQGDESSGTLPFEIKTGKSNAGMEHRAQTMLYTLLMSDRYDEEIDSGLLYYSQSNQVFRVRAARNEIRSLLISRNQFATYLHRRMTLSRTDGFGWSQEVKEEVVKKEEEGHDQLETPKLMPEPIDEERSCKWCYVSDACMLFRKTVEGEAEISTDETDPLQIMYEAKTGHLTETHAAFFKKWETLISYEEQELVRFKKEIWTMGAAERMALGRCLANMAIDDSFDAPAHNKNVPKIHRFTYRLQLATPLRTQATASQRSSASLLGSNLSINDPIVVSLENPSVLAISRGFVVGLTSTHITLGLDHSLTDNPQAARATPPVENVDFVFRIDKDELAAGMGRIRDNLVQLFVAGGDERRRRLIVDGIAPEFEDVKSNAEFISTTLNIEQQRAVEKVLSARDYALILGMPGTGKTTTIAEILKALAKAGKSVLLTSYTHSAVDNILLKVKDAGLSILRLGNRDKIMPALHQYTLDPEHKATTVHQLDMQLKTPQIVATTCLSINEPIFTQRHFDVCIVDEASQVTLPTCLGPLRFADTFVLVGDHNQLRPLVRNRAAKAEGLEESLFKILAEAHPSSVVELSLQYRMNDDIMLLSNRLVYGGRLKAGSLEVASRSLDVPQLQGLDELHSAKPHQGPCWLREILKPERKVIFVDTDLLPAPELKRGPLITNEIEARLVRQTAAALVSCGVAEENIGVIALYRQQIKIITTKLSDYPGIEVLTADRSQGRDKECIIMSLTRSNADGQVGDLLKDWRRMNVCFTRAKAKLIIFGSKSTLSHVEVLKQFFDVITENDWLCTLPGGADSLHTTAEVHRAPSSPAQGGVEIKGVKRENDSESAGTKKPRVGGGALVMGKPLLRDIVNCA